MIKDKIERQDLKLYFRKLHEIKMLEAECIEPDRNNKIQYKNYLKKCNKVSRLKNEISSVNVGFSLLTEDEKNILYQVCWQQVPVNQVKNIYHVSTKTMGRWINKAMNKINTVMGDLSD
ncbi:hypothetical protein ACJDU8_19720 [Clostridium sp. WILCCON 0269]|uniref:RNA polymerase sigma-70 region 4 domain-containing protein n=1 Tax=Candidatus Clostridium eludens TaxID=3381663 RepID=A0ABW8ST57_9CLOT